jgi:hypothetical protein
MDHGSLTGDRGFESVFLQRRVVQTSGSSYRRAKADRLDTDVTASVGLVLFVPQIIKQLGVSNLETGFLTMIPYVVGTASMIVWGYVSDRMQERGARLRGGQNRRLALGHDVFRAADRVRGIDLEDVAGHEPVEQHPDRREVLVHRGRGELALQFLDERGDMEGLHLRQLVEAACLAPLGKAARGVTALVMRRL